MQLPADQARLLMAKMDLSPDGMILSPDTPGRTAGLLVVSGDGMDWLADKIILSGSGEEFSGDTPGLPAGRVFVLDDRNVLS